MKKLLTTLCLVLLVSCSNQDKTEEKTNEGFYITKEGVLYYQGTDKLVNGKVEEEDEVYIYKKTYKLMVGMAGFEPTTTTPPVWCATRLRYIP